MAAAAATLAAAAAAAAAAVDDALELAGAHEPSAEATAPERVEKLIPEKGVRLLPLLTSGTLLLLLLLLLVLPTPLAPPPATAPLMVRPPGTLVTRR